MFNELLGKIGLLTNPIWVVMLLLGLVACVPQGIPASTPPPINANLNPPGGRAAYDIGISVPDRYGIDANGNGVIDMPNAVSYVQGPLHVTLNADSLAKSYPSKWPYENTDSAEFYSTQGPWRWTFTPSNEGAVPQGLAELPTPTSTIEGFAAINDGQRIVTFSDEPLMTIDLFEGEWSVELARIDATRYCEEVAISSDVLDDEGAASTGESVIGELVTELENMPRGTRVLPPTTLNESPFCEAVYWTTATVIVEDYLIVQLGDSYASGEGAPDRDAQAGYWGDDGTGYNSEHISAHRSSYTWGSVVASQFEQLSTSASVTFINLAVSGAVIDNLRAQLDQLSGLVGVRKVNFVLISIGGNDAGFENAIAAYMLREPIENSPDLGPGLSEIEEAIKTGNWTDGNFTDAVSVLIEVFMTPAWHNVRGLNGLNAGYQDVANALAEHGIDPVIVYILQYPDLFVADPADPDTVCPGPVLTSVSSILGRRLEIGRQEQRHARKQFIMPLNQQIATSAQGLGWHVIEAERVMYGHAICQDEGVRMAVRHDESQRLQGDRMGTLHPNKIGYEAIAVPAFNKVFAGGVP